MALFIVQWKDKPGAAEARAGAREAHLAYVRDGAAKVVLAGPFLNAEGGMVGSMLIVEADSLEAAQAFNANDPYKAAGVFETASIDPFKITVGGIA